MSDQENSEDLQGQARESEFASRAEEQRIGIVREFVGFLVTNKKWWLLPIIMVLLVIGALVILGGLGGGAAAPFIYTLF